MAQHANFSSAVANLHQCLLFCVFPKTQKKYIKKYLK